MKTRYSILIAILSCLLCLQSVGQSKMTGYATVNGLKMYYEVHGTGKPLVLLHGAFMSINTNFGHLIPGLSKNRQVIAVEMQAHGHTEDISRPISFESSADDVAALLQQLKIDSADILGFSFGGSVAFQIAIRHPKLVRKLVILSATYKFEGWLPETRSVFPLLQPEWFDGSPMRLEYDSVAPKKNWAQLISKMKQLITTSYDFTAAKIEAIKAPALLVFGDADGVAPEHVREMYSLFGGGKGQAELSGFPDSQLAVLPATSHTGLMEHTDWLLSMIQSFLK